MSKELPEFGKNNEQILKDIQLLQENEKELFNYLELNPGLDNKKKDEIINKMNELSNLRLNLYETLSGVNNYYQSALNSSIGTLKEQVLAIGIVESELNKAKLRLKILEEEKNNKVRLVEINNYFSDKYLEHTKLMKIIIAILIPVLILAILNNKGILPTQIYYILVGIISFIGAYFFWKTYGSIITRDNMNYQEYAWNFNPKNAPTGSTSSSDPWASSVNYGTCVGDACCSEGMYYDISLNICVPGTNPNQTTESFINENDLENILSKQQQNKFKIDYDINNLYPSNYN
jgi:hypothetical protein